MEVVQQAGAAVDPIAMEVVRNLFVSAAEEMKINLARAAYNPVVFEMYDFAVGVFDAEANMIAQAPGLPVFLGTLRENVKVITEDIGGLDQFRPGDLYMMNDPYAGGTHLLDVTCVVPVFDGDRDRGLQRRQDALARYRGKGSGQLVQRQPEHLPRRVAVAFGEVVRRRGTGEAGTRDDPVQRADERKRIGRFAGPDRGMPDGREAI